MAEQDTEQQVEMTTRVTFPEKQALLKWLIDEYGNPGLILSVAENEAGETVAKRAEQAGFNRRKNMNILTMSFDPGKPAPYSTRQVAELLGGVLTPISFERFTSDDMIVNLYARIQALKTSEQQNQPGQQNQSGQQNQPGQSNESGQSNEPEQQTQQTQQTPEQQTQQQEPEVPKEPEAPKPVLPDPDSMEILGLNMRGEEVIRDIQGRFFRRVVKEDGSHHFIHESEGGQPALFLRAIKREDLGGIAAGIMRMAQRGTLHQKQFDRILDAALEEGPGGQLDLERDAAANVLREYILRQITDVAIDDDKNRASFIRALRLSANTGHILSRATGEDEDLRPGASLLSLIRRSGVGYDQVDFSGAPDLDIALPRMSTENAAFQVQDFSRIPADGMVEYALNVLTRRPDEGNSIFIVPSGLAPEHLERLRSEIGMSHGLESVADISPGVADGVRDGRGFTVFFIGDKRPEPLDSLPRAALRSFAVVTDDDLVPLESEINRSRRRIREFNLGEIDTEALDADEREENTRQRPYQPLSRTGEPFTMIGRALEGATAKALERVSLACKPYGGIDAVVARTLGRSVADLGEILTPEQVDAIALRLNAAERGRGFLQADQTGIGKGRAMAALVRIHLRKNIEHRCLYVTESAGINVRDVMRDIKAVDGMREVKVMFLTQGSHYIDMTLDPETGEETHREIKSVKKRERDRIFESGVWPEEYNLIITTYSQFTGKEDSPRARWISSIADHNTLFILDEAHNTLTAKSNRGRNFRNAINRLLPQNVVFATGTPARNPHGMDLYKPLLPHGNTINVDGILDNIARGGEVAQETFATMLADDGVMIRRDHDLSTIDYRVDLPDDRKMLEYHAVVNRFSPIVEQMIDVSIRINEIVGRNQAVLYRQMINNGMDERQAIAMTNDSSQYSLSLGGPLQRLARIMMIAIKVDQTVEAAVREMNEGRKLLVTFHSTNEALFREKSVHPDGTRMTEEEMASLPELTIRDQIRRIHNLVYSMKIEGETVDPRENNAEIMRAIRLFSHHAQNRKSTPLDILMAAGKMRDAISRMVNPDNQEWVDREFSEIETRVLPRGKRGNPRVMRNLLDAYVDLTRVSCSDIAESDRVMENFAWHLNTVPEGVIDAESMKIMTTAIKDFERKTAEKIRAATGNRRRILYPATIRFQAIESMKDLMHGIALSRGKTADFGTDLANLETRADGFQEERIQNDEINEACKRIDALIDKLPDLPVSPVDALIERLEANDISTREISGRTLCYRDGCIRKRTGTDRIQVVDDYNNSGKVDALLFNTAGVTGGSFHADINFQDQRGRTQLEFETPPDIIKDIQGQGRGNRLGQVTGFRIVSIMTGLSPEMRMLQQRYIKLRIFGASTDGNRMHPLLNKKSPDLLNVVGDEATRNVLLASPVLATRLGFSNYAEDDFNDMDDAGGNEMDIGAGNTSVMRSLANKVLARSIILPAHEQDELIELIKMEFEDLVTELESVGANPLSPRELGGTVDILATSLFSGQEIDESDYDTSVFSSPVYVSTGEHEYKEGLITAEQLVTMVERAIVLHGSDGFRPQADRITQNLAGLLRPWLPAGFEMEEAFDDPYAIPGRFGREHDKLVNLAWILENIRPGAAMQFRSASDSSGLRDRIIVDLIPPKDPGHYDIPSAYKVKLVRPGQVKSETVSVSRIMKNGVRVDGRVKLDGIRFLPGLSDGFNDMELKKFSEETQIRRQVPVQVMGGNILQAITEAKQHKLGTISLYRDIQGQIHRGIVVREFEVDMNMLPVSIPGALIAAEITTEFARKVNMESGEYGKSENAKKTGRTAKAGRKGKGGKTKKSDIQSEFMVVWGSMEKNAKDPGPRNSADIRLFLTANRINVDIQPLRKSTQEFYQSRPGLYETIHDCPFPENIPNRATRARTIDIMRPDARRWIPEFAIDTPEGRDRLYRLMSHLGNIPMMTDGQHRSLVNTTMKNINLEGPKGFECKDAKAEAEAEAKLKAEAEAKLKAKVDEEVKVEYFDAQGNRCETDTVPTDSKSSAESRHSGNSKQSGDSEISGGSKGSEDSDIPGNSKRSGDSKRSAKSGQSAKSEQSAKSGQSGKTQPEATQTRATQHDEPQHEEPQTGESELFGITDFDEIGF